MVYKIVLALTSRSSGRDCRACNDSIPRADRFGVSEGVCAGCRL